MKITAVLLRLWRIDYLLAIKIYLLLYYTKWMIEYRHLKEIIAWIKRNDIANKKATKEELKFARKVANYTRRLAALVPFESKCYDKALTVKRILNQEHISASLNMGVKTGEQDPMEAHAWIQIDSYFIIGGEVASEYVLVQSFY